MEMLGTFLPFLLSVSWELPQQPPVPDVQDLIRKLGSEDIVGRERAEQRLRSMDESIIPALEGAAGGEDSEIAARCGTILKWLKTPPALRSIRERLSDGFPTRADADMASWTRLFLEAGKGGPRSTEVRRVTLNDLEELWPVALRDAKSPGEVVSICELVTWFGLKSACPKLRVLLRNPDPKVRGSAVVALTRLGDQGAGAEILEVLADRTEWVRLEALTACARLGVREAIPVIVKMLPEHLSSVLWALGKFGDPATVPMILPFLENGDEVYRFAAAEALAGCGSKASVPILGKMLENGNPDVRMRGVNALHRLLGRDVVSVALKLLEDRDPNVRSTAIYILGPMRLPEAEPDLLRVVKIEDWTATTAAYWLAEMRSKDILPIARKWLSSSNLSLKCGAMAALGVLGDRESSALIARSLGEDHEYYPGAAALALARIGAKEYLPSIVLLADNRRAAQRCCVAEALGIFGEPECIAPLRKLAADLDPDVREKAAHALSQCERRTGSPPK